jgi:hypothetical protein
VGIDEASTLILKNDLLPMKNDLLKKIFPVNVSERNPPSSKPVQH